MLVVMTSGLLSPLTSAVVTALALVIIESSVELVGNVPSPLP